MRKLYKFLLSIVIVLLALILFVSLSPYPTAWATRFLFSQSEYTKHETYESTRENIELIENIKYPSTYKNNTLDIIYPKNPGNDKFPIIFWVHGGAFVAGDKKDVTSYMVTLANEGFTIVNINYELAPGAKYPAPLVQVGEAYTFIIESNDYPFMDKDIVYFGGDSAGAHIASQFILIQTNNDYVTLLNEIEETKYIKKTVHQEIKGAILFAGPYDFDTLSHLVKGRSLNTQKILTSIISFFAKRIGQGYLGELNWKGKEKYDVLSVTEYVNSSYPEAFLTDGRKISFEDHSKKLESKLTTAGVSVTSVYYNYDLVHEYQFNLGTVYEDGNNYAQMTFDRLLEFLSK